MIHPVNPAEQEYMTTPSARPPPSKVSSVSCQNSLPGIQGVNMAPRSLFPDAVTFIDPKEDLSAPVVPSSQNFTPKDAAVEAAVEQIAA